MKKTFTLFFAALFLTAAGFTACSDDKPEPPGPGPEKPVAGENEYGYDGQIEKIQSVYVLSNDSETAVLLSPQAGLKTYQEFLADGVKYLHFQVDNSLTGKTVDLKSASANFMVDNRTGLAASELTRFDQTSWSSELSEGSFRIAVSEKEAEVSFAFTLLSGNVFQGKYKGAYATESKPVATDSYSFDGTKAELKSVLVMTLGNMIYMYMSPQEGLLTQGDFSSSDNYLLLGIDQSMTGRDIDVTAVDDGWAFYNMTALGRDALETLDPFTWEDVVSAGMMRLDLTEDSATALFTFTTLDGGKIFSGNCTGDYVAPLGDNSYSFDGETVDLKSAFYLEQAGMKYLYLSPEEGLTTLDQFADSNNYLLIAIDPSLEGERVDVMTATDYFAFYNMSKLGASELVAVDLDTDLPALLSSGELSLLVTTSRAQATFSFTLLSGKVFEGSYSGPYAKKEISDDAVIYLDGEEKQINAAFYEETANGVAFYFTPAAIESAVELEDVIYYVRLYVSNQLLNQEEVDIETTNRPFEFTYVNNMTGETVMIENGDTQGASGYFSVMELDPGSYLVDFDMEGIGDHMIAGFYEGDFMVYDTTIPNQYGLAGETPTPIRSALIDKSDPARYALYFCSREGVASVEAMEAADPVICYLTPSLFTGNPIGFSFAPDDVSIVYEGVTYDRSSTSGDNPLANGGNVAATLSGTTATVDFNVYFINSYEATLSGHYSGEVVVVE